MPICPTCGAYVKEGVETCSCGTKFILNEDEELKRKFREEELKVEKYREYENAALEAFDNEDYRNSLDYSIRAIELNLDSDAKMKFTKGKSLFFIRRYYDAKTCFEDYIDEYKNTFYRYANISCAYMWKARCQWALGNGFESIKSYYKAIDHVDDGFKSNDEKNEERFRIMEERQSIINASKDVGIYNQRFGNLEYDVADIIEKIDPNLDLTMQNLYDAVDEVEAKGYSFDSFEARDGRLYVLFESDDGTLKKRFDGSDLLND